jgi:hypothetical protein
MSFSNIMSTGAFLLALAAFFNTGVRAMTLPLAPTDPLYVMRAEYDALSEAMRQCLPSSPSSEDRLACTDAIYNQTVEMPK